MSETAGTPRAPEIGPTRVPRRAMLACGTIVAATAVWAFRPHGVRATVTPVGTAPERIAVAPALVTLDVDAFRAPIWVQAPQPLEPPVESTPPRPLKIQLLAILRDGGIYRAALYDPELDRIFVVASGESVAGTTVERVLADGVALGDGGQIRTLSLVAGGTP